MIEIKPSAIQDKIVKPFEKAIGLFEEFEEVEQTKHGNIVSSQSHSGLFCEAVRDN